MSSEKSEKASPRRRQKAREEGDRPRSRDLLQAVGLLAGVYALGHVINGALPLWHSLFYNVLALFASPASSTGDGTFLLLELRSILLTGLLPFAVILFAIAGAALAAGAAQSGGLSFNVKALAPKWSRLNPQANLKSVFSVRSLTRLLKSLIPVVALVVLAWAKLRAQLALPAMSLERLPLVFSDAFDLLKDAAWLMLLWSCVDYAVEWRSWDQRLRMSKQDLRDEYKESEGNPQMRGRIRSLQRQMRRRKARADVSRASVVVTNPTHYAVALSFDFATMDAPKVLAKGRDLLAEQIKADARWAGVPIVENPPLARSLYRSVEAGQSIPFHLYSAVAGILAFLYRREVEERMRREAAAQRQASAASVASTPRERQPSSAPNDDAQPAGETNAASDINDESMTTDTQEQA